MANLDTPTFTCDASMSTLVVRTFLAWVIKGAGGLDGRALVGVYQNGIGEGGHFFDLLDDA